MAYDIGAQKPSVRSGRMPMIGGAIALVLVGVGVGAIIMHRSSTPVSIASPIVANQVPPPASQSAAAASPLASDTGAIDSNAQPPTQTIAMEQQQLANPVLAIPAVVTNAVPNESKPAPQNLKRAENTANSSGHSLPAATRRPTIANLKMGSPSAPNRNVADLGGGTAPIADMVATQPDSNSGAPVLLTSSGRVSTQPLPPPGVVAQTPASVVTPAPADKTVSPKLISSARLIYPPAAKQTGIQGTVMVQVNVDANGAVSNVRALNGPLLLRQAAVDSVKQWKFSPGTVDGKPAGSQMNVAVEFKLN